MIYHLVYLQGGFVEKLALLWLAYLNGMFFFNLALICYSEFHSSHSAHMCSIRKPLTCMLSVLYASAGIWARAGNARKANACMLKCP